MWTAGCSGEMNISCGHGAELPHSIKCTSWMWSPKQRKGLFTQSGFRGPGSGPLKWRCRGSFSRSGLEMEVDTVNIFGADAWKGEALGWGLEHVGGQLPPSCTRTAHGRWRWALATGPSLTYFHILGCNPSLCLEIKSRWKACLMRKIGAGGEESGWLILQARIHWLS